MGEKRDSEELKANIKQAALTEGFGLERKAAKVLLEAGFYIASLGSSYLDFEGDESGHPQWRECDLKANHPRSTDKDSRARLTVIAECKHIPANETWTFVVDRVPKASGPYVTTDDQRRIACEPPLGMDEAEHYFHFHPHFSHNHRSRQCFVFGGDKRNRDLKIREAAFQAVKPGWHDLYVRAFGKRRSKRLFVVNYIVVSEPIAYVRYAGNFDDAEVEFAERILFHFDSSIAPTDPHPPSPPSSSLPPMFQELREGLRRNRQRWFRQTRSSMVEVVTLKGLSESAGELASWFDRIRGLEPQPEGAEEK